MDDDAAFDFSELDPARDSRAWNKLVGTVVAKAAPELDRRRSPSGLVWVLTSWKRPILTVAATLALLATAGLLVQDRTAQQATPATSTASLEDALRLFPPVSQWVVEGRDPTTEDLVLAMGGELP
jgi:acyl-CoA reductase-like NAD-dependent aldehyde dehydrogenase